MNRVKLFSWNQIGRTCNFASTFTSLVRIPAGEGQVGEAGRYHFGIFRLYPRAYTNENKQADYPVTSLPTCLYWHYQHRGVQLVGSFFLMGDFFLIFCRVSVQRCGDLSVVLGLVPQRYH